MLYIGDSQAGWLGRTDDADNDGAGVYVAMENTATVVTIGAGLTAGGPVAAEFWDGDIMLPFITGRELSEGDCHKLFDIGMRILGL